MPNLFKRKQVWFQVLVYSRCHKRSKPHSLKMAWQPGTAQNLKIRPSLTILRHGAQTRDCGSLEHILERDTFAWPTLLSLQSAISIKLSPLLVFTVVAPIIAIHKLQTLPFHSLLGRYLQVQFAIWLCHYHGGRCHYLFSSFAIFGCSGNTTNKTMLYTKCS